jgi:hypothetical protein
MRKTVLSLVLWTLILSPSAYAFPQRLAVNLRSDQAGADVYLDPDKITLRDGVTVSTPYNSLAPLAWSPKYGISGSAILVSDLPGITGMWIDDITTR